MLVPVILGGFLAKRFGKRFDLDVSSPREAVRALCVQLKGFERALLDHQAGFRVWADKDRLDEANLARCTGQCAIHIVPVVAGAKSGWGEIILGAALIYFSGPIGNSLFMEGSVASAQIATGISAIGTALVLGGVSQLLFKPPTPPVTGKSYLFNGPVNTTAQGNPVPICYGRMRVGSQLISAGIVPNQLPGPAVVTVPGSGSGWYPTLTNAVG